MSVSPFARMNNSAPNGEGFMKFDIWEIFENPKRKFKFHLKNVNNNGHFTWTALDIYDHISLSSS